MKISQAIAAIDRARMLGCETAGLRAVLEWEGQLVQAIAQMERDLEEEGDAIAQDGAWEMCEMARHDLPKARRELKVLRAALICAQESA